MVYTVGEMAKLMNLPASTIRYYDNEGLLPFVERSDGGRRVFRDADYETLKVIECLKKTGLSIREIKAFIDMVKRGDDSIEERLELFLARKEALERQLADLNDMLELVRFKCWYYETAKEAGSEAAVKKKEIPPEFKKIKAKLRLSKA